MLLTYVYIYMHMYASVAKPANPKRHPRKASGLEVPNLSTK